MILGRKQKVPTGVHNGRNRVQKYATLSKHTKAYPVKEPPIRNNWEAIYADRVWRSEGTRGKADHQP